MQPGEERVHVSLPHLDHSPSQKEIWAETQKHKSGGRSWCRDHGGVLLTDLLSMASLSCFLQHPGPPAQGWHCHSQHSHVYHQSRNACPRLAHRPSWLGHFLSWGFIFPTLARIRLTKNWLVPVLYYSSADLFIYFFTAQELYFLRPLPFSLIVSESLCSVVQILFTVTQWLECLKSRNLELGCDFATESWWISSLVL